MAVNKIKITKAVGALIKAGMQPATARNAVKLLDLDKAVGPQIAELVEEDPELFGLDDDGNELPDEEPEDDDTPMTAREAQVARLRGTAHLEKRTFRRPAQERPSTAPATAREAAEHLRKGLNTAAPVTPRYRPGAEPKPRVDPRHTAAPRPASADKLAARLRGN